MSNIDQGGPVPPNYDYTVNKRQKTSYQRRKMAYDIVKALAQQMGYMSNIADMDGLDRFLDEYTTDFDAIDWFDAIDSLTEAP